MSTDRSRRVQPQSGRVDAEPGHHLGLPGPFKGGRGPVGAQSEHTEGPGRGDLARYVSSSAYVCMYMLVD